MAEVNRYPPLIDTFARALVALRVWTTNAADLETSGHKRRALPMARCAIRHLRPDAA